MVLLTPARAKDLTNSAEMGGRGWGGGGAGWFHSPRT